MDDRDNACTTMNDEPARRKQPRQRIELRWGVVKLVDWFDRNVLRHRVFRLCCLIADSQWWTGDKHPAASFTAQAGGIARHDLAPQWRSDAGALSRLNQSPATK